MRADRPSATAAWVAAARALGAALPADARLADDPYGAAFASPALARALAAGPVPRALLAGLARAPGMASWVLYLQVRTRVLDDAARGFAAAGGRQVVLLGAGYDCRALRLSALAGSRVVEVDHPTTQRHKRAVLDAARVRSPATYLAWDFERDPLAALPDRLAAAGLDLAAPTLTIWEGVTMYLTEPAIEATVAAIAAYAAPGSRLAMTYFSRDRLRRPSPATRAMTRAVALLGEPFRWGWDPAALPAWLAARGFHLDRDVPLDEAARQLLPPRHAARLEDPTRRIALASAPATENVALASRRSSTQP